MFSFRTNADGQTSRNHKKIVIASSGKAAIGGLVKLIPGGIDAVDAVADTIYAVCEGIVVGDGNVAIENALPVQYDGTFDDATKTYTASADNQTDKRVKALVRIITPGDELLGKLDDTKGTSTGSDVEGSYGNIVVGDSKLLDESTFLTASTTGQFMITDVNPAEGPDFVVIHVSALQLGRGPQGAQGAAG